MEWIDSNVRKPTIEEKNKYGKFLCCVVKPVLGGGYERDIICLGFNGANRNWNCDCMIVTHWAIVEMPKED